MGRINSLIKVWLLLSIFIFLCIIFENPALCKAASNNSSFVYNDNGRLVYTTIEEGSIEFSYDKNGNLISKDSDSNLLLNGRFENGSLKWGISPAMSITGTKSMDGFNSLFFSTTTPELGTATDSEQMQVNPNSTYTISGWILNKLTAGGFYISWYELDEQNNIINDHPAIWATGNGEWEYDSITFKTAALTKKIIIRVVANGGALGQGYVDGLQLEAAEPSFKFTGSFEDNSAKWNLSPVMFLTGSISTDGFKSIAFNAVSPQSGTASDSKLIRVKPNRDYTLSGWVLDELNSGNFYISWYELDDQNNIINDLGKISATGKGKWEYGSILFKTSANTKKLILRVVANGGAVGKGYVDRIQLKEGSSSLIGTGSFENKDTKWNISSTMSITGSNSKDGSNSLTFVSSTPEQGSVSEYGLIQVFPNTTYTLSGWILNQLSSGGFYISMYKLDDQNNIIHDIPGIWATGKGEWEYGSNTFKTSSQTKKLIIRVVANGGAVGSGYVDGIKLIVGIPE